MFCAGPILDAIFYFIIENFNKKMILCHCCLQWGNVAFYNNLCLEVQKSVMRLQLSQHAGYDKDVEI